MTVSTAEYHRKWRIDNKDKIHEYKVKRNIVKKDEIREYNQSYYQTHQQERLIYQQEYRKENKEKVSEYGRVYHLKNRDRVIKYHKQYHKTNKEKIDLYNERKHIWRRMTILQLLSDDGVHIRCAQCADDDIDALHIDHINGGGLEDKRRFAGNYDCMLIYYINHPDEAKTRLRILCANCNIIKYRASLESSKITYEFPCRQREAEQIKLNRITLLRLLSGNNNAGLSCAICGYNSDIRALDIDHINNDGYLDRKRLGGVPSKIVKYYLTYPEIVKTNLQILCSKCNWKKRLKILKETTEEATAEEVIEDILIANNSQ
jgi:hypothetical protein